MMSGWQVYFVSNEKVIGCMGKSMLMTTVLANVGTFNESSKALRIAAESLLCCVHPLDKYPNVTYSLKWHDKP
jgi:hypothetical protein